MWSRTIPLPRITEEMEDTINQRWAFNTCKHTRTVHRYGARPICIEYDWLGNAQQTVFYVGEFGHYSADGIPPSFGWGIHTLPPGLAASINRKALNNVLQQVPAVVSIANFIAELRNPKELIPRLTGWKTPADLFLWWNFGASPLIQDVKRMLTLIADVNARLDHLVRINRRPVTHRFRDSVEVESYVSPEPSGNFGLSFSELAPMTYTRVAWCRAEVSINVKSTLDIYIPNGGLDVFRAACTALGLLNPAAIVWEAIPFSFILDWFVRIGDWIEDNMTVVQPFNGTVRIHSSNHTIRTETQYEHWAPTSQNGDWEPFAMSHSHGYYRSGGMPGESMVTDGLTPHQQALGASLLISNSPSIQLPRRMKMRRY